MKVLKTWFRDDVQYILVILVMLALADCCAWGMFSKITFWIISRLKSNPPWRMTAGIGIISALQQDEWPKTMKGGIKKKKHWLLDDCWSDWHPNPCSAKPKEEVQNIYARIRIHYFTDYFLSLRVTEHTSFVIYHRFRIMLCLLCAVLQPWTRRECEWPISSVHLWWPCSIRKLWEPDEISKNPNLSPHLDRAASWGVGFNIRDRLNKHQKTERKKKEKRKNITVQFIICVLSSSIIPLPKGIFKVKNYSV